MIGGLCKKISFFSLDVSIHFEIVVHARLLFGSGILSFLTNSLFKVMEVSMKNSNAIILLACIGAGMALMER